MTAEIVQFIPRANPKADRAFWIGGEVVQVASEFYESDRDHLIGEYAGMKFVATPSPPPKDRA